MLLLQRKPKEVIRIGDDIKLIITKVEDKQVKIGISAPATINIKREELLHRHKQTPSLSGKPFRKKWRYDNPCKTHATVTTNPSVTLPKNGNTEPLTT